MRPSPDQIERAVRAELRGIGDAEARPTVEDELILHAVRAAVTDVVAEDLRVDPDAAELGARLALRLIARLGRRYVGEARIIP